MENKAEQTDLGRKKKRAAAWLILTAVIFAVLIFSVWFCFEKIKEASLSVVAVRGGVELLETQARQVKDFKSKYENYLLNFQKIDKAIINPQNPLEFIEFLEDSAAANNVDLVISPILFSKESGVKIVSVQLVAKGEFSNAVSFLKEMENGPYLISMQKLALESVSFQGSGSKAATKLIMAVASIDILAR